MPGGGIDKCESAASALVREIREELNKEAIIEEFLGVIENRWNDGDISYYETNFLFRVNILGNSYKSFISNEDKLSFFWFPVSDATSLNIKPESLKKLWIKFIMEL